jgi:hypothetical protein
MAHFQLYHGENELHLDDTNVPTKTWMGSVLFDHISACRIVFRSKIVIAVIHFGNVFNSACFIGCLLRNIHRAVNQIYSGREQVQQYFKNSLGRRNKQKLKSSNLTHLDLKKNYS